MTALTISDLNNAKSDLDHVAAIATSDELTAVDRLGQTKATIAGVLASIPDSGVIGKDTRVSLELDLQHRAGVIAMVTNDTIAENNTTYRKVGPAGAGSWVLADASPISLLQKRTAAVERDTEEILQVPSRFTQLRVGLVDSASGLVHGGTTSNGESIGRLGADVASVVSTTTELENRRFSSLGFAVVDQASGLVIYGLEAATGNDVGVRAASWSRTRFPAVSLTHVGGLGQSLMAGSGGIPLLSTVQPFKNRMFDRIRLPEVLTAFSPLVESTSALSEGETIMSSWTAQTSSMRANPVPMLATVHSAGGHPINSFIRISPLYQALLASVRAARDLCANNGDSYAYFGTAFLQGEQNDKDGSTYAYYLETLKQLAIDLDADVRTATGQVLPVPLLVSQVSNWTNAAEANRAEPMTAIAQYQASKDLPGLVALVAPKYMLPYVDGTHLSAHGYRWHGAYFAKAQRVISEGGLWRPLEPLAVRKRGPRAIVAEFHLPGGFPLTFDTSSVTDPNGQKGFEYVDDAGAAALTSVQLVGDDAVCFTVARDMAANPRLRYAFTGTRGAPAGPNSGPRGCLRNTDPLVSYYSDAGGAPYPLFDWCIHFVEEIV